MKRKYLCGFSKCAAVFCVVLFLLWLFQLLSALIPNEALRENMEKSVFAYKDCEGFELTDGNKLNSVADNYADSIWLNIAWNLGEENPLVATFKTSYYDGEMLGENAGLYYTVIEGTAPNNDYSRYWHGSAMLVRLFHLFTDVEGIKCIGFVVFLLLVLLSVIILVRRKQADIAVILVLSLLFVSVWNIRLSLEYQSPFIIAFVLIPFYLAFEKRGDNAFSLLSVVGGVMASFFDFLTTETVTLLLPLALVIAVRAKEKRLGSAKQNIAMIVKSAVCWLVSYAGAFLVKWALAGLVAGKGAFDAALSSAAERMESYASVFSPVISNFTVLFGGTKRVDARLVVSGILISLIVLVSIWYLFRAKQTNALAAFLLLLVGFAVPLRFIVLGNHSYLHCFFTYRALVTFVFAVLSALWLNVRLPFGKRREK